MKRILILCLFVFIASIVVFPITIEDYFTYIKSKLKDETAKQYVDIIQDYTEQLINQLDLSNKELRRLNDIIFELNQENDSLRSENETLKQTIKEQDEAIQELVQQLEANNEEIGRASCRERVYGLV